MLSTVLIWAAWYIIRLHFRLTPKVVVLVFFSSSTGLASCQCREVYDAAQTRYKGRCTAPLLIDKKQQKLVSNESSDIMRMLNSISLPGGNDIDLYPHHLQAEINEVNDLVYDKVCPVCNRPVSSSAPAICQRMAQLRWQLPYVFFSPAICLKWPNTPICLGQSPVERSQMFAIVLQTFGKPCKLLQGWSPVLLKYSLCTGSIAHAHLVNLQHTGCLCQINTTL